MLDVYQKYDLRGELTDEFVIDLARRFAPKHGSVVVMNDSKKSSNHFSKVFCKGINEAGYDAINCGSGPTDMCGLAGIHFKMASVMFTASHLSDQQDGIKFHDNQGIPFSQEMINELKSLPLPRLVGGGKTNNRDFNKFYKDHSLKRYHELFDHDLSGLKILVDLRGGVGKSPELLKLLGAEVIVINTKGSDPVNGNLKLLIKQASDYDLVLVHDFDADRIVFVNEQGVINGSLIACMLTSKFKGKIVASIDSSSIIADHAEVIYPRVGDPFIARSIIDNNACLGVEQSGHYTDPLFTNSSSGSYFALIIAGLAYEESLNSRLLKLPQINVEITSVSVPDKDLFMNKVLSKVNNIISLVDGVKFFFNGCPALVRPSGTEPLVRFYLEKNNTNLSVNELVRWLS